MFEQINNYVNSASSSLAYIYCCDNRIIHSQTYHAIKQDSELITEFLKELSKGSIIGVQLGHKLCLLPVIYCLLKQKIAFILLEENDSYSNLKEVKLSAIISCLNHADCDILIEARTDFNYRIKTLTTKNGCSLKLYLFKYLLQEEQDQCLSYTNICYIISTSGTLGQRKIVKVTEDAIYSNITSFIKLFNITQDDVIYFGTPLSFDPSLVELFLALTTGACLIATPKGVRNNPKKLIDALFSRKFKEQTCTFLQMCPSFFCQFSTEQMNYILSKNNGLRVLGLGGELFPTNLMALKSSHCKIYNFYGITEVSCWASIEEVLPEQEVSLGQPLDDTEFYIENDKGDLVYDWKSCDMEGTLHIGSSTRLCYLGNESNATDVNQKIVRNSGDLVQVKNGRVFYAGRANDIIKRFGHRVSLIKMQQLIYTSISLPNTCIFYKNKVVCFIKLQLGLVKEADEQIKCLTRLTIDKVRVKLLKDLATEYMPDHFELLSNFPIKSSNGKMNKPALETIAEKLIKLHLPKNPNDLFVELWCYYLGIEKENLNTFYDKSFWDAGGNSMLAMQFAREYEICAKGNLNRALLDLPLKCILDRDDYNLNTTNLLSNAYKGYFSVVWKSDMKACIDTTPTVCAINEHRYVAVGNFAHIFSVFEINTGEEVASITLPNVIESAVLMVDNKFFVPCFDGQLYCIRLHSSNKSDTLSLQVIWSYQTKDRLKNKPCFDTNNIIFASYDGHVYAISMDGILQWKTSLEEPVTAEIKHYNRKLYVGGLKSNIYCLSQTTGGILWRYKTHYPIFNSPEISQDNDIVIFVDIESYFYAFSLTTDECTWTFTSHTSRSFAAMLMYQNSIILGTHKGYINFFKFDASSCELKSSMLLVAGNTGTSITSQPLLINIQNRDYLLIVNNSGELYLYLIDLERKLGGTFLYMEDVYSLGNACFSSPQVCNLHRNRLYLGCRDNYLYCIEININK